jgi:hypothetical protein
MKPILRFFMATSLLSTTLFTACKKENDSITPTTISGIHNTITTAPPPGQTFAITYRLSLKAQDVNSPLHWTSGYTNSTSIAFEGFFAGEHQLTRVYNETPAAQTGNLFLNPVLGTVMAVPGAYKGINYLVNLIQTNKAFPLYLSGIYKGNNGDVPVQLIVSGPQQLRAQWSCCTALTIGDISLLGGQKYAALLSLSLEDITRGITNDMLASAAMQNGTITISESANSNLYNIVKANLNKNIVCGLTNLSVPSSIASAAAY